MARPLRVEFPGAIYHVSVRMLGNWKKEENLLFEDDADRKRFLAQLAERVEQYGIRLYQFCLLNNHFHLVFETPQANCSMFMQALSTAYTVSFNLRHRRHGHLLDGRYKARSVNGDEYLLALSRYVHLNPVEVGTMKDRPIPEKIAFLRQYPWSSYPGYAGLKPPLEFVEYAPVLAELGGKRRLYREFVETGLAQSDEEFKEVLKASPRCIGGQAFRAWMDGLYQKKAEKRGRREDVAFRRMVKPLEATVVLNTLAKIFAVESDEFGRRRRDSALKGVAGMMLVKYAGLTQREAAATLGVQTGAAISTQIRKVRIWAEKTGRLRRQLTQASARLDALRAEATS